MARVSRPRLGRWATAVVASALVLAGGALLAEGLRSQHHAPQPQRAAAGVLYRPPAPTTTAMASSGRATTSTTSPAKQVADPVAIDIPAIGVHSGLGQVGLMADHTIQVPTSFDTASWFRLGVRPGANGPAIILGHVDSKSGPGVFFRLGALHPGDTIAVARADGSHTSFTVTAVRSYAKAAFPSLAVYGDTPTPTIRLITCGGAFDSATGHYLSNTIVFGQQT